MTPKIFTLIIFFACYGLILSRKIKPFLVCFAGILILLIFRVVTLNQAAAAIDYNVLGVFLGTMILSSLFIHSGVPAYLAAGLVNKSQRVGIALILVCALSSFISSFTENIATVLIVAPLALELASVLSISPVPLLIGISLSANLQGCATMIGDPPSIILAMESGMNFNDFFWMPAWKAGGLGKLGIFFAVQIGALGSFFVLWNIFRRFKQKPKAIDLVKPRTWMPTWLLIVMTLSLVVSSFLPNRPQYMLAGICLFWGLIGIIWHAMSKRAFISPVKDLDWESFFFLIGIFILVGSLSYCGIIEDIARYISFLSGQNVLFAYSLIIVISVVVSAFVDNIPYTLAMIPAVKMVAADLGVSMYPFLFGLLIGACVGGNITPIGSVCNIVTVGLLRRKGYQVKFSEFFRVGLPFTIVAVFLGSLFIWLTWM
ncbi:MAG: SLC13 family permease [Candidatus Omnitrophota bacterium]